MEYFWAIDGVGIQVFKFETSFLFSLQLALSIFHLFSHYLHISFDIV